MSKPNVSAERKQQIVNATVDCITKFGYHNFSMQDVAKAAGVSKGIIHYYFLNKDELMLSVLERVSGNIETFLAEEMKSISDPLGRLEVFIKGSFDIVKTTREYYQVSMDFWTQINQKKKIKSVISSHYDKFRNTASQLIEEGIKDGVFRNVNPKHQASFIIAIVDGLSLQWLFDEEVIQYDDMIAQAKSMIISNLKA